MTSSEKLAHRAAEGAPSPASAWLWAMAETARLGWNEYRAVNPPVILVSATVPRVVLQTIFFTLLGGVVAGPDHRRYAFVGALALGMATMNVVGVANVPVTDKQSATFWRIRTGRLHPAAVFLARSAPYPVAGLAVLVVNLALVAPIAGLTSLGLDLLPLLGLYALMSCTLTACGLVAGSLAIGRRAEVLSNNLLAYLIILCSGAFLPNGRLPWIDAVGSVLPLHHGLIALRAALDGAPWEGQALMEAAVGAAWAVAAAVVTTVQIRRAHRQGHDDFE
ncbi:ABC transporter permease [Streptomyces sp. NBC_01306]|uniref:ABC transporter permease n=1 Tax=Streptomyces sp. NBC_01306 TaxID=2903819 RepID=UPI002257C60A|nr:ABC transporter permease [Streptomyces sp. NBC_01306]MCX4722403.1 ABC transporter permease [Streptomyces sp. NBC_01306]